MLKKFARIPCAPAGERSSPVPPSSLKRLQGENTHHADAIDEFADGLVAGVGIEILALDFARPVEEVQQDIPPLVEGGAALRRILTRGRVSGGALFVHSARQEGKGQRLLHGWTAQPLDPAALRELNAVRAN